MSRRSPFFPAVVVVVIALLAGIVAPRFAVRARSADETARALMREGEASAAEALYWQLLETEPPTVARTIDFLDAHLVASVAAADDDDRDAPNGKGVGLEAMHRAVPSVSEPEIDAFLARPDLPPDVSLLGRFWRSAHANDVAPELRLAVHAAADAEPPMPWANHLLGRQAEHADDLTTAAARFLREGKTGQGRPEDVNHAFALLVDLRDWAGIGEALKDPTIERFASPAVKARWAAEVNAWSRAARWLVAENFRRPAVGPLVLAVVAALAWLVFAMQLGKAREQPLFRLPMYLAAFALGTVSVIVTDLLILLEESKLNLVETGDPLRDFIFFTFGVGLREELSKLLLFLPLVPLLRWKGKPVDVLVCGACVGLGFAAMENLGYLASGDLSTGLGRFLTANFLHMAMTAILASAAFEYAKHGDAHAPVMSRAALQVIAMHGAYDFFITHRRIGGGYLAMVIFFFLVNQFLAAVDTARGRSEGDERLLRTFMLGTATVVGASFVWASLLVGPGSAAQALTPGLLGMAIVIYAFAQRFRRM